MIGGTQKERSCLGQGREREEVAQLLEGVGLRGQAMSGGVEESLEPPLALEEIHPAQEASLGWQGR